MKAVMSGRASAFAVQGERNWTLHRPSRAPVPVGAGDIDRVFGNGPDVVTVEAGLRDIEKRFLIERSKDRALRLILILLDPGEEADGLDRIAGLLDPLLEIPYVVAYVENQLMHRELPCSARLERAIEVVRDLPAAATLLARIADGQDDIRSIREAFDRLPDNLFEDSVARAIFHEHAINTGTFRKLTLSMGPSGLAHAGIVDALTFLKDQQNARSIVIAWTRELKAGSAAMPTVATPEPVGTRRRVPFRPGPAGAANQLLRNALEQQNAIVARIAAGDYETARRYAADLERHQLANGDREHLAMSLTRLSQAAREMEAFELDLEWARKAVEMVPDDGRAQTQLGDALLAMGAVDEALTHFRIAEGLGNKAYALSGRARAMRMVGDHATQLALHEEADNLLAGTQERVHPLVGRANALADARRWTDATDAFEEAESLFPYEAMPRLSHGWFLLKQGCHKRAWDKFEEAEQFLKDKSAALNGLAETLRRVGRLAEARIRFSDVTRLYPRDPFAYLGLIDTLRDEGKRNDAARYAQRTAQRFPGSSRVLGREAMTASESGRHSDARRLFGRAIRRFPREVHLVEGQVAALMREGAYDQALKTVDDGIQRFQSSPSLARMRANVLRRLRQLEASRPILQEITEKDDNDQSSRNALASILIIEGEFDKAEGLVANDNPQTSDDWRAFLLHATLLERRGEPESAYERLAWGAENCPFANDARLFRTAIASQALRAGQARKAPRVEPLPVSDVGNVVDFQVAAATKRSDALQIFQSLGRNLSPTLVEARDSIAYSYNVAPLPRGRSKKWIGHQLNDEILLAAA